MKNLWVTVLKNFWKTKLLKGWKMCPTTLSSDCFYPFKWQKKGSKKNDQLRFLGNCPPTLPYAIIITYFSLRAKCWLRGGVGGQFPKKPKESVAVAYGTFRQGDHLIEVINSQTKKITCWHLWNLWPQTRNGGDTLIGQLIVIKGNYFQDFGKWPLNQGWPLICIHRCPTPIIKIQVVWLCYMIIMILQVESHLRHSQLFQAFRYSHFSPAGLNSCVWFNSLPNIWMPGAGYLRHILRVKLGQKTMYLWRL